LLYELVKNLVRFNRESLKIQELKNNYPFNCHQVKKTVLRSFGDIRKPLEGLGRVDGLNHALVRVEEAALFVLSVVVDAVLDVGGSSEITRNTMSFNLC
jgi:hypothetical protein